MNSALDTGHGLTKENFLAMLPAALCGDRTMTALAEAAAALLAQRREEIERLRIYPAIDRLDEGLLDILAYDFKVDWWDADYSLEEKRRTLKDSWRVHKMLGTKAAVETAISAIYPQTTVQEWFEYGGRPYHFKLRLDLTGTFWTEDRPRRILERVNFYKSLRSHVDGLEYTRYPARPVKLHVGGTGGILSTAGIPEDTALPTATTILRIGGVCTIISNLSGGSD